MKKKIHVIILIYICILLNIEYFKPQNNAKVFKIDEVLSTNDKEKTYYKTLIDVSNEGSNEENLKRKLFFKKIKQELSSQNLNADFIMQNRYHEGSYFLLFRKNNEIINESDIKFFKDVLKKNYYQFFNYGKIIFSNKTF